VSELGWNLHNLLSGGASKLYTHLCGNVNCCMKSNSNCRSWFPFQMQVRIRCCTVAVGRVVKYVSVLKLDMVVHADVDFRSTDEAEDR
jgi:hypothetical protein